MLGIPVAGVQAVDGFAFSRARPGIGVFDQIFRTGVLLAPNEQEEETAGADRTDVKGGDRRAHLSVYSPRTMALVRASDGMALVNAVAKHRDVRALPKHHNELGVGSGFNPDNVIAVDLRNGLSLSASLAAMATDERRESLANRGIRHYLPTICSPDAALAAQAFNLTIDGSPEATLRVNDKWNFNLAGAAVYVPDKSYDDMPRMPEKWRLAGTTVGNEMAFFTPPGTRITDIAKAVDVYDILIELAQNNSGLFGQRVFAKLTHSAAGRGVVGVTSKAQLCRWLEDPLVNTALTSLDPREGVMIDLAVKKRRANASPNINIYIADDEVVVIGGSYQVLEGETRHIGNQGPVTEEDMQLLMPHIYNISRWAHAQGFRGIAGIDFVIGPQRQVWGLELNGRFNGSTAGVFLALKLSGQDNPGTTVWHARNQMPVPRGVGLEAYASYLASQRLYADASDSPTAFFDHQRGGAAILSLYSASQGNDWGQILVFGRNEEELARHVEIASSMPPELVVAP